MSLISIIFYINMLIKRSLLDVLLILHSWDLRLWYDASFGYPLAKPLGIGYVQELVARLTETRIPVHNSSTNATLDDNPATFPLGQSLYVDATHEVVVLFGAWLLYVALIRKPLELNHEQQ